MKATGIIKVNKIRNPNLKIVIGYLAYSLNRHAKFITNVEPSNQNPDDAAKVISAILKIDATTQLIINKMML